MPVPAIDQLKSQYTDQYVAVDPARPELARFRGAVGQVKTVNMNGRALVQFLDYHLNTGWYDIALGSLKIVDAPPKDATAKPEAKRGHDKPVGKAAPTAGDKQVKDAAVQSETKKLSPLEMARMQGAGDAAKAAPAKPAAAGGKKSTADILAAARGGTASAAKAEPKPAAEKPAAAEADAPAKVDRSKMSVAEMLAAARANKPAAATETEPAPAAEPQPAPVAASPAPPEPAAPEAAEAEPAAAAGGVKRVDKSTMTVDEMIAYCRQVDAK